MTRSSRSVVLAGLIGLAAPLLITTTAIAAPVTAAPATTARTSAVSAAASSGAKHITIPWNYSYHPHRGPHIPWHDYCTKSPDAFRTWGKDADFRGPCARHDMCYQYKQHKQSTCNSLFYSNLKSECNYTYKHWYDPRKSACLGVAWVYYKAVQHF